jgi:hypothetical protein
MALTRISDAEARKRKYVVVEDAGYEGERDVNDLDSHDAAY